VVLTNGPRGPGGEVVGEEVCNAVKRKAAALEGETERRHGEGEAKEARGSQACLAPTGPAPPRERLQLRVGRCCSEYLRSPSLPLPLSFSSSLRVCGQGIESPVAARVGKALGGCGGGFL
jgi:hypothetical protein